MNGPMSVTLLILVNFFLDFAITAGSILGGAMLEGGTATVPNRAVILLALIVGFVTASRRAQAALLPTPGQAADTTERVVERVLGTLRALEPLPPARGDTPPPVPDKRQPPKDSA